MLRINFMLSWNGRPNYQLEFRQTCMLAVPYSSGWSHRLVVGDTLHALREFWKEVTEHVNAFECGTER